MKIQTDYWRKPIPTNKFDWSAVEDDYDLGSPSGHGATEDEAVRDLLDALWADEKIESVEVEFELWKGSRK